VRYQDRHGYQFFSPSSYRLKCQKHPKAFSAQGQYFWFRVIKATKNDCVQGLQDQKKSRSSSTKKMPLLFLQRRGHLFMPENSVHAGEKSF
jgi:hypothetical protein